MVLRPAIVNGRLRVLAVAAAAGVLAAVGPGLAQDAQLAERAADLHSRAVVVDGHNDLPWEIRKQGDLDISVLGLGERRSSGHTDMVRLREGGVDVQFWAAYVPARYIGAGAAVVALEQVDLIHRLAATFPEQLEMAYDADDIVRIVKSGRTASLIGIEGGHAIANSLPVLRMFYDLGVRYLTLTHSANLPWSDAAGDSAVLGGLSEFGRDVVREMNRLGMLVDLSHVTPAVMRDAIATSAAPVIFSHSSARAVRDVERNVPDDILAMLPDNGGVVMINFYSDFLVPEGGTRPGTVATIADHIDHVVAIAGIDHVGLGSDFDGIDEWPLGMEDVSMFPNLTVELMRRGYSDEDIMKVLGDNLIRALRQAETIAADLRASRPPAIDRLPYFGLEEEPGP